MCANTLFLRLEGPMQSWGGHESKFVIRRTEEAPSKSGVIGMLCAAMGVPRNKATDEWLPRLSELRMGVRADRSGVRWWDYHTVGAKVRMRSANGKEKKEMGAMLTRREYLCDASFLVALQGESGLIAELYAALRKPKWTLYLGRKCCPPSRPILEHPPGEYPDLYAALCSIPWRKRLEHEPVPNYLPCLFEWVPTQEEPLAPRHAAVRYDVPINFDPPAHIPRFVIRDQLNYVGRDDGDVAVADGPVVSRTPRPLRQRANYNNSEYKKRRLERLDRDHHLCVFCKLPATTVQHVTYRHAGGGERLDELRALCRLCHDAVTMIEYGINMGMDRIDPEEPKWRDRIIAKRREIIDHRSLETRRRRLESKEVE